ncbi:MAG TPA: hypothetical protein VF158_10595 [Longimicrobiales bacterium]
MYTRKAFRRGSAIVATGIVLALGGCDTIDSLLQVNNPANVYEDQLQDETLVNVLTNSVIGRLAADYDEPILWTSSMLTDEQVSGINWPTTKDLGKRVLPYDVGPAEDMFDALSRIRFLADSVASRLEGLLEQPEADRRMALVLAYGGYAYTLMAEIMCEATIDVGAKIYTPQELAEIAIQKFERAIAVAEAAGATADSVRYLAYVGLARAATAAGNKAKVMDAARQVPPGFVWWVEYKQDVQENDLDDNVTGTNHNIGVHKLIVENWGTYGDTIPPEAQTDPRIQFNPRPRRGHDGETLLYTPYQPLSFSGYTGTRQTDEVKPVLFTEDTDIRLGSYLDAMHNYYEAAGPDGTGPEGTTLEFVNKRRAVGNQPPVSLSGDALMAELREQRLRDLYLGGFRLGDLRRWKAQGIGDFFPKGTHPNPVMGEYGTAECFPLPLAEYIGNPNLQ